MTDRQPLEETPEVAAAVEDDTTVPQLMTGGGPDDETPEFCEPATVDELSAAADADQPPPAAYRTGADQPWDPEDLAVAEGRDPTPENVGRARRELEEDGPAAVERTVP